MKNLPFKVRIKAIEIANAMLKEHPKMDEGEIIATATKNAKIQKQSSENNITT